MIVYGWLRLLGPLKVVGGGVDETKVLELSTCIGNTRGTRVGEAALIAIIRSMDFQKWHKRSN